MKFRHKKYGFICESVLVKDNAIVFDTPYGRGLEPLSDFELVEEDEKEKLS